VLPLSEVVRALVDFAQTLAENQAALLKRQQELEQQIMVTKAEVETALTQMETALRAAVATIGATMADQEARVTAAADLTEIMGRINAATQTIAQLEEAVQNAAKETGR
jgi:chromosome segregation ATPase